jgi:uncharacterized membrane protein YesL
MLAGLRATRAGLGNFRQRGYAYIWTNLAFVALSLPVITAPGAYSALMRVGHLAHTDPSEADLAAFWETFKTNLLRAIPWGLAHALFALVNFNNVIAYAGVDTFLVSVLESIWLVATVIWLGILLYTWPIYYEMAEPTLWGATRNALVMVLRNPLFTLVILLVLAILAAISTVLVASWLLLTFGVFAAVANAAVQDRLAAYREAART